MPKDVLFFFVEADGRVRQIVNGVVTSITDKVALPQAPIGSQDISIGWKRSSEYMGNIRNFSLPLGFVMDAAKILRNDMYKFNIDRELYLLILRYTSEIDLVNYKNYYKYLYKGQLDFSTFNDKQHERTVEMSIMEGGVNKLLKSQAGIEFDIPFDEDSINILMDGIDIEYSANYAVVDDIEIGNASYGSSWFAPFSLLSTEGTGQFIAFASQSLEDTTGQPWATRLMSANWFGNAAINNSSDVDCIIEGKVEYICTEQDASNGVIMKFIRSNQLSANQGDYIIFTDIAIIAGQIYSHDISITIPLQANERIYLEGFLGTTGTDTKIKFLNTSKLTVSYKRRADSTIIKAFKPITIYKKIAARMGIAEDSAVSDILSSCTYCIASGDSVRGLLNSSVKTTMNDFFKAFHCYLMAGLSVENNILRFESLQNYFVKDSVDPAVELGQVKNMEITPAKDLLFSSIKVGHKEQQIDDINGKYDFNGYQIWASPEKTVEKQFNLQSPYKAGPYEIEIKRQNLEGKTTTDDKADNDVFVLDAKVNISNITNTIVSFLATGNYLVFQSTPKAFVGQEFSIAGTASNNITYIVTGVDDLGLTQTVYTDQTITVTEVAVPVAITWIKGQVFELNRDIVVTDGVPEDAKASVFNVALTPNRILRTWFPWLRSFLYGFDSEMLIFESANRNKDLVAGGITENADIAINDMGEPIARPFYLDFETEVPTDLVDTMDNTPNKSFALDWEQTRYTGFLYEAGIAPTSRQEQKFKLLMSAESDPKTLIL